MSKSVKHKFNEFIKVGDLKGAIEFLLVVAENFNIEDLEYELIHQLARYNIIQREKDNGSLQELMIENNRLTEALRNTVNLYSKKLSSIPIEISSHPLFANIKNEAQSMNASKSLALIMKGGGAKGLAYVGAIKILEKEYKFDWFIGTSAGAIAAVLLGAGFTIDELEEILSKKDFKDFLDKRYLKKGKNLAFHRGINTGQSFKSWISALIAKKLDSPVSVLLEDLPNRVTVFASTREKSELRFDSEDQNTKKNDAAYAVRCSMSIPGLFVPENYNGKLVFDGGLQNNYPIQAIKNTNPNVDFIGLYLGSEYYEESNKSAFRDISSIALEAKDWEALREYKEQTLMIDPRPIKTLDFSLSKKEKNFLIEVGELAARKFLAKRHPEKYKMPDTFEFEKMKQNRIELEEFRKNKKKGWVRRIFSRLSLI